MSQKSIAVTTDFSAASFQAFPRAAAAARRFGAELRVVHLAQLPALLTAPWPEVAPYIPEGDSFAAAERRLAEVIRSEPSFQGLTVRGEVVRGEGAESLRDHLARTGVVLVVIASHGRSGLARLLLGSFAEQLLRLSRTPVLIARAAADAGGPPEPRRILVPHDFSVPGSAALHAARDWARAFGARARLLFVAESTASLYDYAANMQGSFAEYLERIRAQALERFRRIVREEWSGIDAEGVVVTGEPVAEILRDAREHAADLIVLATHSRTGLERLFLGSVTQKVAQQSPVSVLAVRGE